MFPFSHLLLSLHLGPWKTNLEVSYLLKRTVSLGTRISSLDTIHEGK